MATADGARLTQSPLSQMAGWAGVIMTLVGFALWPVYQTADRHQRALDRLVDGYDRHTQDGHPLRFAESIESNIIAVNERNRVLQQQLDALKDQMQILHKQNQGSTDRANNWIDNDGALLARTIAAMREQLAAIERQLKARSE